mmetsp:Transcript_22127/g.35512  ORF Transcript_22127/g.35512 Transcript_22127/m.35512 type:complete len:119 (+) Transcript_22127:22-378(+)
MTISVNIRINQYFRETASCQGQQTANFCLTDTRVRKMFGVLRKSVLGTQSVKNAVNKQTLRNFGEDVQVGRPLNRWGPHAMWKKGLVFAPFLLIIWYPSWYVTKNLRKHKLAKEAAQE